MMLCVKKKNVDNKKKTAAICATVKVLPDSHLSVLVTTEHALAPIHSLNTLLCKCCETCKKQRNIILQKRATSILNVPCDTTVCVQMNVVLKDWPFYFGG